MKYISNAKNKYRIEAKLSGNSNLKSKPASINRFSNKSTIFSKNGVDAIHSLFISIFPASISDSSRISEISVNKVFELVLWTLVLNTTKRRFVFGLHHST